MPRWTSRCLSVRLTAGAAFFALAACAAGRATPEPAPPQADVRPGYVFAVSHCSACHAVTANGISPNPLSPPFEAIVNRPGNTRETLVPWLDNSHYYPDIMAFEIKPGDVEMLADYMMTLQDESYRPLPQ